jgi:hypothetical protein
MATGIAWFYFAAGYPTGLWQSGLFSFTTAAGCVGLLLALCVRFDRKPTRWGWLALAAGGSILFFAHVTAPIMLVGGLLAFYAASARRHGWRWHAAIIGAAAVAVVANLVWLVPLWKFRGIREGGSFFFTDNSGSGRFLLDYYLGGLLDGYLSLFVLIPGLAGLVAWAFGGRGLLAMTFGGSALVMFGLGGFGSLWGPTRVLEPIRFLVALSFLLALPAGSILMHGTARLVRLARGGLPGTTVAALAWAAILGATWAAIPERAAFYVKTAATRRPLAVGLTPEMTGLVDWLRAHTDDSARILFEDQLRILELGDPESVHWTPLLPILLGPDARSFIGGVYHMAFIRHNRVASFGDFHLAGRLIDEWSPDALRDYCDQYNVGWVVCWSPLSRFWFDRDPGARRVATLPRYATPGRVPEPDPHAWDVMARRAGAEAVHYVEEAEHQYAIYRVERPHSFFLRGQGRVVAMEPNRIELADVVPYEGSVLLSLHWLDTWQSDPPTTVSAEPVPLDSVPFVRIDCPGPVPRLVLSNGYGRRPARR